MLLKPPPLPSWPVVFALLRGKKQAKQTTSIREGEAENSIPGAGIRKDKIRLCREGGGKATVSPSLLSGLAALLFRRAFFSDE